ncbi:Na+/H+ antiporter subunit E [Aestuariibacter halophilus]|uniref:Na+/H+ antiporter subunit E n=1 Tax=Fluctibacter halophilus TaxID=226011 RepID=A0ABS8G844_9ALTE|nr:Na+/H+ antiporter subunit E [Aestuariibacter halophilus]MCC2616266.1 Na+/H+ antiporter subunit E [Aestuariibacter halophilus]
MKHLLNLGIILAILWLVMSGHFTPLLMSLGLLSVVICLFIAHRMDVVDGHSHPVHMSFKLIRFWLWLGWQIILANIDVAARILGFKPIKPQLIAVPLSDEGELHHTIYANSITLTPGSASVHMLDDHLIVHTISAEGADELLQGDMAKRIPTDRQGANNA